MNCNNYENATNLDFLFTNICNEIEKEFNRFATYDKSSKVIYIWLRKKDNILLPFCFCSKKYNCRVYIKIKVRI